MRGQPPVQYRGQEIMVSVRAQKNRNVKGNVSIPTGTMTAIQDTRACMDMKTGIIQNEDHMTDLVRYSKFRGGKKDQENRPGQAGAKTASACFCNKNLFRSPAFKSLCFLGVMI